MTRRFALPVLIIAVLGAGGGWWHFSDRQPELPEPPARSPAPAVPVPRSLSGELRPVVAEALDTSSTIPWEQRLDLVRTLPADLAEIELEALLEALLKPRPAGVSASLHSSFLHEIATLLQKQPAALPRFAQALAVLVGDTGRDAVSRDYALQHLRQAWQRAGNRPALRETIAGDLREWIALDSSVSVSALLSLHLLGTAPLAMSRVTGMSAAGSTPPDNGSFGIPDSEITPLLAPLFSEKANTPNLSARLTAARIAGERRLADFRQPLLAQLTDPSEHALVRMAAANAIGKIGNPGDLAALAAFDPRDDRVAAAIRHALGPR